MKRCVICGSRPGYDHHILPKSVYPEFRHKKINKIVLCAWHHTMDEWCCPHGNLRGPRNRWWDFLEERFPEKFAHAEEHSRKPLRIQ